MRNILIGSVLGLFLLSGTAKADLFLMEFTFENFIGINTPAEPAPTDPVIGSIVFEAATIDSFAGRVVAIDLTIDGYTYSAGEVDSQSEDPLDQIGGIVGGVDILVEGENDFGIIWDPATQQAFGFFYTTSNNPMNLWGSVDAQRFSITAIPEPSALTMTGWSLLGLLFVRRRATASSRGFIRR